MFQTLRSEQLLRISPARAVGDIPKTCQGYPEQFRDIPATLSASVRDAPQISGIALKKSRLPRPTRSFSG